MARNILIKNEKCLYFTSHYFNEEGEAMTPTMLKERKENFGMMSVVFCPNCKKMHPAFRTYQRDGKYIFTEKHYPLSFFEGYENPVCLTWRVADNYYQNMVCPSCGENLSKYKFVALEKRSVNSNNSRTLKSMKVFEPADDKLIASIFVAYYYPNTYSGKLAVIPVRYRLVFNYKTGLTYFLQGRTLDGKHPKFDSTPEIFNATLGGEVGCCVEINAITKNNQIVAALAEELLAVHGGDKSQLTQKGDFSDTTFTMLTVYNNIPYFNYGFYYMASKNLSRMMWGDRKPRDRFTYKLRTLKERYELNNPEVFKKYLFKGTKLDIKKSIRKELFANPFLADYYKLIVRAGFKNHDVIRRMLKEGLEFLISFKTTYDEEDEDYKKLMLDFIKMLIREKTEVGACNTLLSARKTDIGRYLKDTALMYAVFKKRKMFKSEYFKGDLSKIHDNLAKDYKKIKEVNVTIDYKKEAYDLNDEINGFIFSLARDTYELIDIGQEMHICVGSYGNRAAAGQLIIVKMTKNGEYVGCIELSKSGKDLRQAKACFNNRLEERKAEALKIWVEKHKINTNSCYDYDHIAKNNISYNEDEIYQGHVDYAGYGMGDIARDARRILGEDEDIAQAAVPDEDDLWMPF